MVCTYCGRTTRVTNSRHQKRLNTVWRRRQCVKCNSTVTTEEAIKYESALMVQVGGKLTSFSRDKLMISLYKSLAHRKTAAEDAAELCSTVIAALRAQEGVSAVIERESLLACVLVCLGRFDSAASSHYRAYHVSS